jgi:type VI secretion system protein VasD
MNINTKLFLKVIYVAAAVFLLTGCAAQYPTILQAKVTVAQDANPDIFGQPSPIVISLYQLTNNITFNSTDFPGLYQNAKTLLGEDFVNQYQFEVAPGQSYNFAYKLDPKTRYIGVVAAYSQINTAAWRQTISLQPSDYAEELFIIGVNKSNFDLKITAKGK